MSDGIDFSNSVYGLQRFLVNQKETDPNRGPIWCDNRGAVLVSRKGVDGRDEIPKKSRHIAIRFAQVLEEAPRIFWCPTEMMKADGLTKSGNKEALKLILENKLIPRKLKPEKEVSAHEENFENENVYFQACVLPDTSILRSYFNVLYKGPV